MTAKTLRLLELLTAAWTNTSRFERIPHVAAHRQALPKSSGIRLPFAERAEDFLRHYLPAVVGSTFCIVEDLLCRAT